MIHKAHRISDSKSDEDLVCDSYTANSNMGLFYEANVMVNRCNVLDISFTKTNDSVFDEMCKVVKVD